MEIHDPLIIGYRISENLHTTGYHSHQEYEILMLHEGNCRYLIGNQIYDLEPGDILLMDGKTLHKPNVSVNQKYIRSVIHFAPEWIEPILKALNATYLLGIFKVEQNYLIRLNSKEKLAHLEQSIARLEKLYKQSGMHNGNTLIEMKVVLIDLLISINKMGKFNAYKKQYKKGDKEQYVENIASYIQRHYMEKLTVGTIASALNLSKSYMSHLFKEMTGFTIMEYLMGCRINQAKYLLENDTEKPLKDVARECGFENASHFSRYFKEKVGRTPKEYRRLYLNIFEREIES